MSSIKPIYLIALVLVILFVFVIKISNPYRKYGTVSFWENATLDSVAQIPDEALLAGNKNGPVIMWAAMGSGDTKIIKSLFDRGADINESDGIFNGTPLTGAAGYSKYPEIIEALVTLGADINKRVHNEETALMIAAQYNEYAGIITMLVEQGAKLADKNKKGESALDLAKRVNNLTAIKELQSFDN